LKNHTLHLIVHASLHLLGYDHVRPEDAELMEGIEREALARVGIADPYA
jgi:probable rRNA maturation factor